MYAGEWFKGQCHGCGIHICEDGCIYYGELKGGIKHGIGHYRFRSLYVIFTLRVSLLSFLSKFLLLVTNLFSII
ncbi:hypothetical protein HanPSC8_Chr01g0011521 [Helianthus annuus]|nr:hypothetical protein HanPSC8_Chr01g0011521 [Helianthus annuus]